MESITLTSNSKSALKAIKAIAKEMPNISVSEKTEEETNEYYYLKGVRVTKAKGKLDIEKLSGSFPIWIWIQKRLEKNYGAGRKHDYIRY